nr:carbohydrate ABC transporter permease [Fredinandcohnia onubensis]
MKKKVRNLRTVELLGIGLALIWLVPFYLMVVNSFKTKKGIFTDVLGMPEEWTFANFVQAFIELDFAKSFLNSFIVTFLSVLVIIIFSTMAGYALSRNKSKLSTFILFSCVALMLVPFQSIMIPLVTIYGELGMLNQGGLVFMYLGLGCSMGVFLVHGAMRSIPNSLDEAAKIDGANKFQIFFYIIFPLLKPISVTIGILNVIWIWNDFLLPSLVLGNPESQTIPLKMFLFFGQYTKQWHLALAGLTIAIIPIIIVYFFAQKHIIKGVSEGAVK